MQPLIAETLSNLSTASTCQTRVRPQPSLDSTAFSFIEEVYVTILNSQKIEEPGLFLRGQNGELYIAEADLMRWRVSLPSTDVAVVYLGDRFISTCDLPQSQFSINVALGEITLDLPFDAFNRNQIDLAQEKITPNRPISGAFINYDLFAQKQQRQNLQIDGLFELGTFNSFGSGSLSFITRDFTNAPSTIRLDTNWIMDRPDEIASYRLGDGISRGGNIGRPVRFAGFQVATNFNTRPDFITYPQLDILGSAGLPSTLELFINNTRTYSQNINPGPFSIINVPVITGAGQAKLIVRDVFGREQVINQAYYGGRSLLKKDLHDFSYEAGIQRFNYAIKSEDYARPFLSATHKYGLSNQITAEGHIEADQDVRMASISGYFLNNRFGILDVNYSLSDTRIKQKNLGQSLLVGYENQGETVNYGLRSQWFTPEYTQLGFTQLSGLQAYVPPERQSSAFVGWSNKTLGSFSLSYIDQRNRQNNDVRLASANYSRTLFNDWFLNANFVQNLAEDKSYFGTLTIVRALGERTTAVASSNYGNNINQNTLQIQESLPVGSGLGYRLQVANGDIDSQEAGLSYRNDVGTYGIEAASRRVQDSPSQQAYRANASGSLAFVNGNTEFTRKLGSAFAVVDTGGHENISVYVENQLVGKTNKQGYRVLPDMRPYQKNNIAVEPKDFPINSEVETFQATAIPYFRSADYVKFKTKKQNSATFKIKLASGEFPPVGTIFMLNNNPQALYYVAQNGEFYIAGLQAKNTIQADINGNICVIDFDYIVNDEPLPDLGVLQCGDNTKDANQKLSND